MILGEIIILVGCTMVLQQCIEIALAAWTFTPPNMEVTWGMRMTATVIAVAAGVIAGFTITLVMP